MKTVYEITSKNDLVYDHVENKWVDSYLNDGSRTSFESESQAKTHLEAARTAYGEYADTANIEVTSWSIGDDED